MRNRIACILLLAGALATARAELTIQFPGREPVSLAQFRGRVVVLAVILAECSDCERVLQQLNRIGVRYRSDEVKIFAAAIDQSPASLSALSSLSRRLKLEFPIGSCPRTEILESLGRKPDARFYAPMVSIIDRTGKVVVSHSGYDP